MCQRSVSFQEPSHAEHVEYVLSGSNETRIFLGLDSSTNWTFLVVLILPNDVLNEVHDEVVSFITMSIHPIEH